jgi:hypothetical protein
MIKKIDALENNNNSKKKHVIDQAFIEVSNALLCIACLISDQIAELL